MPYREGEARSGSIPSRIEDENQGTAPKMQPKKKKRGSPVILCEGEREKSRAPKRKPIVKRQVPVVSRKAKNNFVSLARDTLRMGCAATQAQGMPAAGKEEKTWA
jgi:hypothetical protein